MIWRINQSSHPCGRPRSSPPQEDGIALLLVLWIVALLTIIALAMTSAQRTESTLSANQLSAARFRAEADAAISYAALQLMTPPTVELGETEDEWSPNGQPKRFVFAGQPLEISILNEASLIDLNKASREVLEGLLAAVGVPDEDQTALVDAVLDWHDEDDLHLPNGAEDSDYYDAGLAYGAKDGPFDSVEELRQVLGFDRDLYQVLAPVLTVSGGARIQEDLAPSLVLAALRGTTVEEVETQQLAEVLSTLAEAQQVTINRGGPLYRMRVSRKDGGGAMLAMEALVKVERGADVPVSVLWRRYGLSAQPTWAAAQFADEQSQ